MRITTEAIQRSAKKLVTQAEECFEQAEEQHKVAELQHENAEKIAALGNELEADAAKLLGEAELHPPPAKRQDHPKEPVDRPLE